MSIYGEFQDVHGSREPGCNKYGVIDTDIIDRYIDTIILCTGAIVTINVGLAQARPNQIISLIRIGPLISLVSVTLMSSFCRLTSK